ncbi:hypothetical protein [Arthrobacter sp. UYCu723]
MDNLAPQSFFTVASVNPPIIQFTSVGRKDSLRNVVATGEFIVNPAPETAGPDPRRSGPAFHVTADEDDRRTAGMPPFRTPEMRYR